MAPTGHSALCYLPTSASHFYVSCSSAAQEPLVAGIIRYNPSMPRLEGLGNIVTELRAERAHLVNNLRHVDAALAVLGKLEGGKFATVSRRSLSAAARRKMAAAQKARWAKVRGQSGSSNKTNNSRPKRTLSAAARRKIAAAQRARWAKVRAAQSK
jgi:hypothetical protein